MVEFAFAFVSYCMTSFAMVVSRQIACLRSDCENSHKQQQLNCENSHKKQELNCEKLDGNQIDGVTRVYVRGMRELSTFVVVAVVLLGLPFTRGGPALNSVYSLLAGVHHRSLKMVLCHCSADVLAACVAGWYVCLKSADCNLKCVDNNIYDEDKEGVELTAKTVLRGKARKRRK